MSTIDSLDSFPSKMVEACNLAIDHGIFYNEEFESFVLEKIGGFGCEAVLVEPGKRQTSAPGIRHPGGRRQEQ